MLMYFEKDTIPQLKCSTSGFYSIYNNNKDPLLQRKDRENDTAGTLSHFCMWVEVDQFGRP